MPYCRCRIISRRSGSRVPFYSRPRPAGCTSPGISPGIRMLCPELYSDLGYGQETSLTTFVIPIPSILENYEANLRALSIYAMG